jgi:PAS domain S-box-containing protein
MIAQAVERLRVLLVEDNPADARLVREMLRDEDAFGTTITHAERLSEAIDALRDGGFNVVLLDLTLPDSTGIDTFARAHIEARTAPIVVLTGLADRALATRAVRDGAQDYLVKGEVDGRALHQSLRHAVARQAADEALRASEERFRQLVENIREAFVVVDLPSMEVQYVSRTWEDIWGRPIADAYQGPQGWMDVVMNEDRHLVREAIRLVASGESAAAVFRVMHPGGHAVWVRARVFPVVTRGVVHRFVGLMEDITDERRTESQLLQSQRMEAVGRLAGGVAHDFNNLLTAILGSAQLLQEDLSDNADAVLLTTEISRAAESAAALTHQLLAFSRQQILQPRALVINDVISAAEPLLRRLIAENVTLTLTLGDARHSVSADPGQMQQVLINLVANARDAVPLGGRITITTGETILTSADVAGHPSDANGPFVWLSVRDTGIGMDAETQRLVFEPFFTTKELGKGTGLGLATVYGIVKQSRGFISVESAVGQGTTFKVYLPAAGPADAAEDTRSHREASSGTGSETVLLVEDRDETRAAIRQMLTRRGYRVLEAATGDAAVRIAAAATDPIHVLLTDVVMPGLSGRDTAEQVAAIRPGIRVLFMSGYAHETIDLHGVLDASVAFIQKPFSLDQLCLKVQNVLKDERDPL